MIWEQVDMIEVSDADKISRLQAVDTLRQFAVQEHILDVGLVDRPIPQGC
jgi:hypothetical protein